jgi:hypothetical protein
MTTTELERLGEALTHGVDRELRGSRRRTRRLAALAAALAVTVPAVAYGAARLIDNGSVAASMPAGAAIFAGQTPTCVAVTDGVEYSCTLAHPPVQEVQDFKGTVEPTVDATKHVNGGCRSLDSAGLHWECYLGQKAVDEQIISSDFLGQYAPAPGHG